MYPNFFKHFLPLSLVSILAACGGSSGSNDSSPAPVPAPVTPNPSTLVNGYWSPSVPDFSVDQDAPSIALNGPDVVFLGINEDYEELGATASDPQDGDITSSISVTGNWNRFSVGDYFIRYRVTDSSGKSAMEKVRVVRVFDDSPSTMNLRPHGTTASHLGYIESLPADYGLDEDQRYGLFIFNHGNGSSVESSSSDPALALQTIIRGFGPAAMQQNGKWDSSLPIISLSPQMGGVGDGDELERLDAFIDYAVNTYPIDRSKIYITGWSQGGFLSLLYAAEYPQRVAAVVSIAGGFPANPNEQPDDVCSLENTPVWAFHGDQDDVVSVQSSIDAVDYLNQNCQMQILPRLTVFQDQGHFVHHSVYALDAMSGGTQGISSDPSYDAYDISLYDWLFQYQTQ